MALPVSTEKRVYDNILGAMGNTPLVRLGRIAKDLPVPLYAKLEWMNPGGSVKDRVGAFIIEQAEKRGELKPGGTVVEATSGNTGVGLAIAAALKGYKTIFVMPDKMSNEKILLLRAYGAKVVITPTAVAPEDPRSYYEVAKRFVRETPNAILANQYHNPDNPKTHELTTGPELWDQTEGRVTDVIIGMGTGGTITGVGRFLKSKNPNIQIVGVDIEGSILTEIWQNKGTIPDGAYPKTYKVEGIGEDFLPTALDLSVVDAIERAGDRESFLWARQLVRQEGIHQDPRWRAQSNIAVNLAGTGWLWFCSPIRVRAIFQSFTTINGCVSLDSSRWNLAKRRWAICSLPNPTKFCTPPRSAIRFAK